ncbi:MAG TPA: Ni/Fe hydrogenase subunit alpha [Thiobacillaceae bacterium]|nr:Ni/Fe hydrogenase subunit alpha [Thiobacillaceae bacterium]
MAEEQRTVSIHVPVLTRVEGEGALHLRIQAGCIEELKLHIYEPPRFFEKFLEGRSYHEVPDLVARICGICPVAYQITAVQALEKLFGVEPPSWARSMRRILYCGEWIQSHSLHIHLLAAPDFFGYESAISMARDYPDVVRRGLKLQAAGNALMELFGARSVHPVGVKVGGFHHAPTNGQVARIVSQLDEALPLAEGLVRWAAGIPMPQDAQEFISVAMRDDHCYPIESGTIMSSQGLSLAPEEFERHFTEYQETHSTALFSRLDGRPYLVGPLARLNLNIERLPLAMRSLMTETGLHFPSGNMFMSMAARAVEILYALGEARRLLQDYERPSRPDVGVTPRAGSATACTEAPRGLLWHRYETDEEGHIVAARIVPPTSQNQGRIEEDLRLSLNAFGLDHEDSALRLHCEKVIRNYDPCISCATHFLRMDVERGHKQ